MVYIYQRLFNRSPAEGHLSCFKFRAISLNLPFYCCFLLAHPVSFLALLWVNGTFFLGFHFDFFILFL